MISKRRRAIVALLCFVLFSFVNAQTLKNQISNGSFEVISSCPTYAGQLHKAVGWFDPISIGSPDYFNTCANTTTLTTPTASFVTVPSHVYGFQLPNSGNAYAGFATYVSNSFIEWREYVKNKLRAPIVQNKSYCVSFYVSLAEMSRFATANIGFYYSNDSMVGSFPNLLIPVSPVFETSTTLTDTINWTKIQASFTSTANANFFTIGNFRNNLSTINSQIKPLFADPGTQNGAYYFIDDVSIVEINPAKASINDTLISRCVSDSVTLGTDSTEFATYTWSSTVAGMTALSCSNCPNPIAKPQVTTKYYLTKVQCSATTTDSVLVVVKTPTTIANAGTNQLICDGDIIQIGTPDSSAYTSYNWMPTIGLSCTNCATPFANPNTTTTYNLIRQECDLITSSSVQVAIDDCNPTYTVPNVFTPNYDDVNDTWGIKFSNTKYIKNFQMHIYDRWGLLVYSTNPDTNTPNLKWDGHTSAGSECSAGVYFYVIRFDKNEEMVELKGTINLFR